MKLRIAAAILLGTVTAGFAAIQTNVPAEPAKASTKQTYLLIYRPGPQWVAGKSIRQQPLGDHGKYMLSLYVRGVMTQAGPLTDDAGGAVVLRVANEAEAKAIIAADPAIISGVFVSELHPWEPVDWEQHVKKVAPTAGR